MAKLKTEGKKEVILEEVIPKYFESAQEEKKFKTLKGEHKKAILGKMADMDISEISAKGFIAKIQIQDRSKMNEEKLVQRLKDLGYKEAIEVREIPNETVIEDLIYNGDIEAEELNDCLEPKEVKVLKVTKEKKKKAPKKGAK